MNKRGFTLIELISAIVIVLVLLLLVAPKIKDILDRNTTKMWQESEERLVEAERKYMIVKNVSYPQNNGDTVTITKQQLLDENLINQIYDLKNKDSVCDASVVITNIGIDDNGNPKYSEKASISCPNGYQTP